MPADQPMRDNRQMIRLGQVRPEKVLPFFARFVDQFSNADRADLRIAFGPDGTAQFLVPHWNETPQRPQAEVIALCDAVSDAALAVIGNPMPRRGDPLSINISAMADVGDAALIALRNAASPSPAAIDEDGGKVAVIFGDLDAVAEMTAAVVRRSRHAALCVPPRGPDGRDVVLVELEDDAEKGATLQGLLAGKSDTAEVHILCRSETSGGSVYLPERERFDADALAAAGPVLRALRLLGRLGPEQALGLFGTANDRVMALLLDRPSSATPATEVFVSEIEQPGLVLQVMNAANAPESQRKLQAKIAERGFPVGYRVRLEPILSGSGGNPDVEQLRNQIAELEETIDYLQAFSAPQLKLLRFSDAQLPALVDALRRMPPTMQRDGQITFATAHASGRAGPAHFVLYDPAQVALDGLLPEFYWRAATDDHPISYTLDPHAAAALQENPAAPLVFVPGGQQLLPSIRNFGGDFEKNMMLVLGNLFASAHAVLGTPGARPAFVFSPSTDPDFALEVEMIDVATFAPLHLQIKWLNDHLRVRSPISVDPAKVSALAEELYEGELARGLLAEMAAISKELDEEWEASALRLGDRIAHIEQQLAAEAEAVSERIRLGIGFLGTVAGRIEALDNSIGEMRKRLEAADDAHANLAAQAATQEAHRLAFIADFEAELDTGLRTLAQAQTSIDERRSELRKLMSDWRRT